MDFVFRQDAEKAAWESTSGTVNGINGVFLFFFHLANEMNHHTSILGI